MSTTNDTETETVACVHCGREYSVQESERFIVSGRCAACDPDTDLDPDDYQTAMRDADGRPVFVHDDGAYDEEFPRGNIVRRADGTEHSRFKVYGFVGSNGRYEEASVTYQNEETALTAATGLYGSPANQYSMFDTDYGEVYDVEVHEVPIELDHAIQIGDVYKWDPEKTDLDPMEASGQRVIIRGIYISEDGETVVQVNEGGNNFTVTAEDVYERLADGRLLPAT